MPSDAPKRRFRFSLITLIVAVNVAGVLVWANVVVRTSDSENWDDGPIDSRGWPFIACTDAGDISLSFLGSWSGKRDGVITSPSWNWTILSVNIVICLLAVVAAARLTELEVRHWRTRKAKHHDD